MTHFTVNYYVKWVTTSWTDGMHLMLDIEDICSRGGGGEGAGGSRADDPISPSAILNVQEVSSNF